MQESIDEQISGLTGFLLIVYLRLLVACSGKLANMHVKQRAEFVSCISYSIYFYPHPEKNSWTLSSHPPNQQIT